MPSQLLTPNDSSVLTHIFDPESASATPNILIETSLPSDPHIRDPHLLKSLQRHEQQIISSIELTPVPQPQQQPQPQPQLSPALFNTAYDAFTNLIASHPTYASAHNNRAQLIRLRYGNSILIQPRPQPQPQSPNTTDLRSDTLKHAHTALDDLNRAIALLTPSSHLSPTIPLTPTPTITAITTISPLQRKTLLQAHTQRAALFHAAAKTLSSSTSSFSTSSISSTPSSAATTAAAPTTTINTTTTFLFAVPGLEKWSVNDFEEAASRDFRAAGMYGSEMGRVLGVAVNPTAKLCGEMMRGAMRREVGVGAGAGAGAAVV